MGEGKIFTLVFNEKWHLELGSQKYIIISEPKQVEDGYEYKVKLYEEERAKRKVSKEKNITKYNI